MWGFESQDDAFSRPPPPRPRTGESFIKGPIAFAWLSEASRLPGAGLAVAVAFRFHADRFRLRRRWGIGDVARGLDISRRTAQRALDAAERAGVLAVSRKPGRKLEAAVPVSPRGRQLAPLRGPVPWGWWVIASRLPGKAAAVAAVCWWLAGRERSAVVRPTMGDWSAFGLSRSAAARGLADLERAGLATAARRPGRPPVVTIREHARKQPPPVPAAEAQEKPRPAPPFAPPPPG